MARFEIAREVALSADEAWARLTDWERHGDLVPLTTVRLSDTGFIPRTGLGPLAFDDPMDVTAWEPPRFCRLEKRGRTITGWAELRVETSAAGARVTWTEDLAVRGLPRVFDPVVRRCGRWLFGRVLDGLLRT